MSDEALLREILPDGLKSDETMIVVTDASFTRPGPMQLRVNDVARFPDAHFSRNGERVFNGDVVVLIPARNLLVLFHHEGLHAIVAINQQAA